MLMNLFCDITDALCIIYGGYFRRMLFVNLIPLLKFSIPLTKVYFMKHRGEGPVLIFTLSLLYCKYMILFSILSRSYL